MITDSPRLTPGITYLNHGSFGPARPGVLAEQQRWTARMQSNPMQFFCRDLERELGRTTEALGDFVGTSASNLALIHNSTIGMNSIAESIPLSGGDEVLLTDHEYGAVRRIWADRCRAAGATVVTAPLPFPLTDDEATAAAVKAAFTDRTRVIVVSHITSPTAAILPVARIGAFARQRGILTVVDGPHAVAMLPLNLDSLNCDYYTASCHKWLSAPIGSGFLWAAPRHHKSLRCPIVSWGGSISGRSPTWQDRFHWLGTPDWSACLSISAAIKSMREDPGFAEFREATHSLAMYAQQRLLELPGVGPLCTPQHDRYGSMVSVELPRPADWQPGWHGHADSLQTELFERFGIEVPVGSWKDHRYLRVSCHLYNSKAHIDRLVDALKELLEP